MANPSAAPKVSATRGGWSNILDGVTSARSQPTPTANTKSKASNHSTSNGTTERVDEQKKRSENGNILYDPPQTLIVEAAGCATKIIPLEGVPGKQDVQLDALQFLRVVSYLRKMKQREAGNVLVQSVPTLSERNSSLYSSDRLLTLRATVHTDPDGKYRFTTLPQGSFYVSAAEPGWATNGVPPTESTIEKPSPAARHSFHQRRHRLRANRRRQTNKAIELKPQMCAMLLESLCYKPASWPGNCRPIRRG